MKLNFSLRPFARPSNKVCAACANHLLIRKSVFLHLTHVTHLTYLTHLTSRLFPTVFVTFIATFLTGCLFKSATVSPRHFVLAPISTKEPAPAPTEHVSVGIAHVKMPPYLLRDSIAYRDGAN